MVDKSFYTRWRDYDDRMARVQAAVSSSRGACKLEVAGESIEGRPIYVVRLTGAGYSSGKPRVVVDFQLHAREWIVGMAGVFAVESACELAASDSNWMAGMELMIMPTVNPDGTIYSEIEDRMWRKNMRVNRGSSCKGVDLNRNWDPDWKGRYGTSSNACSDTFVGAAAFSEPETLALKKVLDESPTDLHLDVHSYTEVILRPWSHTNTDHPRRSEIDQVGNLMLDALNAVHGAGYRYGGNELLSPASGVCPDYGTYIGGLGYTFELRPDSNWGGGFAPPESEILPTAEETWAGISAGIKWAKDPTSLPPAPTPPTVTCPSYCWACFSDCRQKCSWCR